MKNFIVMMAIILATVANEFSNDIITFAESLKSELSTIIIEDWPEKLNGDFL